MNRDDSIHVALGAASEYSDFVNNLADEHDPTLHTRLIALLLKLAEAMEELIRHYVETDSDSDYELSSDDYKFAQSKFVAALDRDFRHIVTLDATFSEDMHRILMLDDDLSDIYSDIQASLRALDGSASSKLAAADILVLMYTTHWADHLYRALYSVNQLRFGIIT